MDLNDFLSIKIGSLPKIFSSRDLIAIFAEFNQNLVCPDVSDVRKNFGGSDAFTVIYAGSHRKNSQNRSGYDWFEIGGKYRYISPNATDKPDFWRNPRTWYLRVQTNALADGHAYMDGFKIVFELQNYSGLIKNSQYVFIVPDTYKVID